MVKGETSAGDRVDEAAMDGGGRPPREVRPGLWLFSPNRDTQGGSAWWLSSACGELLIDCPAIQPANLAFLNERRRLGRQGWIVLTGRDGHGRCRAIQEALGWPVLVQEQEAYLLPGVQQLQPFASGLDHVSTVQLLWTPGPSPGACVVLCRDGLGPADDLVFCGRLLVPSAPGELRPMRHRGTFHWSRQLNSLRSLKRWLPADAPRCWIATGAPLGALRREPLVGPAGRAQIEALDLEGLAMERLEPAGSA